MTMTPFPPVPTPGDSPAEFDPKAFNVVGALPVFVTEANALQVDVTAKQETASAAALTATSAKDNANTAAGTATTKAGEASASAAAAAQHKLDAQTAKGQAESARDAAAISAASIALPLAISSGGFGGTTADQALTNIGGTTVGKAVFKASNAATALATLGGFPSAGGALTGPLNEKKGADIASAATIDLDAATGNLVTITGATTISAITLASGAERTVVFAGTPTLQHNAGLILPSGVDISVALGDVAKFRGDGALVRCVSYSRYSGQPLVMLKASIAEASAGIDDTKVITPATLQQAKPVLGTAVASTSGTAIDFTGIPSWAKRITISFAGFSTNGTSRAQLQIGTSGGVDPTGYSGVYFEGIPGSAGTAASSATGITISSPVAASATFSGTVTLALVDPATGTWAFNGAMADNTNTRLIVSAGSKSLSGALDRVRVTSLNGTDVFDAGKINILYE